MNIIILFNLEQFYAFFLIPRNTNFNSVIYRIYTILFMKLVCATKFGALEQQLSAKDTPRLGNRDVFCKNMQLKPWESFDWMKNGGGAHGTDTARSVLPIGFTKT